MTSIGIGIGSATLGGIQRPASATPPAASAPSPDASARPPLEAALKPNPNEKSNSTMPNIHEARFSGTA